MIDKKDGQFFLKCDLCGEEGKHDFDTFTDAVQNKRDEGFISRKKATAWIDVCSICQKEGR